MTVGEITTAYLADPKATIVMRAEEALKLEALRESNRELVDRLSYLEKQLSIVSLLIDDWKKRQTLL